MHVSIHVSTSVSNMFLTIWLVRMQISYIVIGHQLIGHMRRKGYLNIRGWWKSDLVTVKFLRGASYRRCFDRFLSSGITFRTCLLIEDQEKHLVSFYNRLSTSFGSQRGELFNLRDQSRELFACIVTPKMAHSFWEKKSSTNSDLTGKGFCFYFKKKFSFMPSIWSLEKTSWNIINIAVYSFR